MRKAAERFVNGIKLINELDCNFVGRYDIPEIRPEKFVEGIDFIEFPRANICRNHEGKGVHFFVDDFQFERIWAMPDRYIGMLAKFEAVMTPDFSMYTDWPVSIQMWNHYRKHVIGAVLQQRGVKVYPSICWSDRRSYAWCFDGEPAGGCVAVSSVGTQRSKQSKVLFKNGYDAMIERLHPETIIWYGEVPKDCMGNIIRITTFQEKLRKAVTTCE